MKKKKEKTINIFQEKHIFGVLHIVTW